MTQGSREHLFPGHRRYRALGPALQAIFGERVQRIPIDAGFACPNRDGARGHGGCLYCDAEGARAAHARPELSVAEQVARGVERALARGRARRFIAYFQAYTNTWGEPDLLAGLYDEAIRHPDVAALAIATRPDCLGEPVLDVLEDVSRRTFLWLEMGLQSTRDETLEAMHRGHTVADFRDAARRLNARGIRWCGHVIFGLPGDRRADMLAAAELLNALGAWGVKMHHLYIDRAALLADAWRRGEVSLLERDEYVDLVVEFLSRLDPGVIIHRLMGEAPRERLLGPAWTADKQGFLRALDQALEERDEWQGRTFEHPSAKESTNTSTTNEHQ